MLKKILVVCFAFVMAQAFAKETPFSGISYEKLKTALAKEDVLPGDRFKTDVLAKVVAGLISVSNKSDASTDVVTKAWMKHYNLPATMSGAEFNQQSSQLGYDDDFIAKLNGVKQPQPQAASPQAQMVAAVHLPAMPETKVQVVQKTTAVMNDSVIAVAIANLEGQVSKLEARGDINVKALKAEITKAAAAQAVAVTRADYQKLTNHLAALEQGASERLGKLEVAVGQLKATQKEATQKIATLEGGAKKVTDTLAKHDSSITELAGKVGSGSLGMWGIGLGLVALIMASTLFWLRNRDNKHVGLLNTAHNHLAAKTAQLSLATGHRMVSFDEKLEALLEKKEEAKWRFRVSDDSTVYAVTLSPASDEGLWYITGIKDQSNAVKTENIRGVIARAARLDSEGNHRLTPM